MENSIADGLNLLLLDVDMDDGILWDHCELFDRHREETCNYVRECMDLTSGSPRDPLSKNATIQAFKTIGDTISQVYNQGEQKLFSFTILTLLVESSRATPEIHGPSRTLC